MPAFSESGDGRALSEIQLDMLSFKCATFPIFTHCFIQYQSNKDYQKVRNNKPLDLTHL